MFSSLSLSEMLTANVCSSRVTCRFPLGQVSDAGRAMQVISDPIAQLTAAIDAICQADPAALGDGATIEFLHRQLARLEAATTRATAAFDAGDAWEADGARSAARWIATTCHLPLPTARRRVHLGRELRHMPLAEAAWLAGDIGEAQVGLLARSRTDATAEAFARDEEMLVAHAKALRFHQYARVLAYWRYRADPDGREASAEEQLASRRLHLSRSFEGMRFLDGAFDPIGGAIYESWRAPRRPAVRRGLGRGQGPGGRRGLCRRPAPHPRPAPGRRRGGDGPPLGRHAGRLPHARAPVQRVHRLRDPRRDDL